MNAIFISFTDSHFHFVKSFWHSLKANYPYHPILLVNYIGNSQEVKDFFRQCNSAELIQVENSYSYSTAHMLNPVIYQRFNLWTEQFDEYDKILYLDVDMIVLKPLDHIFASNEFYICSDHSLKARIFYDGAEKIVGDMLLEDGIVLPEGMDAMANAGMFLIPKQYRSAESYAKLLYLARRYHQFGAFADQSIISLWCLSENIPFSKSYEDNFQIRFFYFDEINIPLKKINILHFSGASKPNGADDAADDGVTDMRYYQFSNEIRLFFRKQRTVQEVAAGLEAIIIK